MHIRTEIQRIWEHRTAAEWKKTGKKPCGKRAAMFFVRSVHRAVCLAGCLSLLLLTGCGKDQELEQFYSEMESFTERAAQDFQTLSGIDPSSETAVDELLSAMDSLAETFSLLAEISVPEEFASIEEIAYLTLRMNADDRFLTDHCDNIESVDFTFIYSPDELFGMDWG